MRMAAESQLETLERRFREALSCSRFGEATMLVEAYSECLGEQLRASTAEQRRKQLAVALDLFGWARRAGLASRAHAAQQYSEIRVRAPYHRTGRTVGSTFEMCG